MATPAFTAEHALGRQPRYRGIAKAWDVGSKSHLTPAIHCHFETHTPDATHGSCWAYEHGLTDWCWTSWCD
jgi:hypothetical protein